MLFESFDYRRLHFIPTSLCPQSLRLPEGGDNLPGPFLELCDHIKTSLTFDAAC